MCTVGTPPTDLVALRAEVEFAAVALAAVVEYTLCHRLKASCAFGVAGFVRVRRLGVVFGNIGAHKGVEEVCGFVVAVSTAFVARKAEIEGPVVAGGAVC